MSNANVRNRAGQRAPFHRTVIGVSEGTAPGHVILALVRPEAAEILLGERRTQEERVAARRGLHRIELRAERTARSMRGVVGSRLRFLPRTRRAGDAGWLVFAAEDTLWAELDNYETGRMVAPPQPIPGAADVPGTRATPAGAV